MLWFQATARSGCWGASSLPTLTDTQDPAQATARFQKWFTGSARSACGPPANLLPGLGVLHSAPASVFFLGLVSPPQPSCRLHAPVSRERSGDRPEADPLCVGSQCVADHCTTGKTLRPHPRDRFVAWQPCDPAAREVPPSQVCKRGSEKFHGGRSAEVGFGAGENLVKQR